MLVARPKHMDETDPILWNDWHPVAARCMLDPARARHTMLLGVPLVVMIAGGGDEGAHPGAIVAQRTDRTALPQDERQGLIRVCLGMPSRGVRRYRRPMNPIARRLSSAPSPCAHRRRG